MPALPRGSKFNGHYFPRSEKSWRRLWCLRPGVPPLVCATHETGTSNKGGKLSYGSLVVYQVYSSLRYNLLFVGEVLNELKVVRMASATLSGFTCGARWPLFATRWIEAALPLNAFSCISFLTGGGLTVKSAVPGVDRIICCFGSHVIVGGPPNDVDRHVRTQCIEEIKREHLTGPVFERRGFLGFRALEGYARSIIGIILGCLPEAKFLQAHRGDQEYRRRKVGSWIQSY